MKNCVRLLAGVLLFMLVAVAQAHALLVVGDSISAAYGLDTRLGWVALLQQRLDEKGLSYQVVNASISGDTTAGGRSRLPALLEQHQPALVIIELGGNDGLRGLSLTAMQDNLAAMIAQAQAQGARVLLLGMRIPPNYGPRYSEGFYQVYQQLAAEQPVALVDFFLEGVGGVPGMIQNDGIHPTEAAQQQLLDTAWPLIEAQLQ
ncbi:MAG: arylesterase [Thiopseudomonas sp.]|nr:arylesterase [Thiopseudomonas sp.]